MCRQHLFYNYRVGAKDCNLSFIVTFDIKGSIQLCIFGCSMTRNKDNIHPYESVLHQNQSSWSNMIIVELPFFETFKIIFDLYYIYQSLNIFQGLNTGFIWGKFKSSKNKSWSISKPEHNGTKHVILPCTLKMIFLTKQYSGLKMISRSSSPNLLGVL